MTVAPTDKRNVTRHWIAVLGALGMAVLGPPAAGAAELRLRTQCQPAAPMVTLGEVAEILGADPAQAAGLAALELFPAPPEGRQRFYRFREIQDLLAARGVDLMAHRFSGSAQVLVRGNRPAPSRAGEGPRPLAAAKKAEQRVGEAVVRFLQEHVSPSEPWAVNLTLVDNQVPLVTAAGSIAIRGGSPPWAGTQRFDVILDSSTGPVRFRVDAQVDVPAAVVVTTRSLPRRTVIGLSDVQLRPAGAADETAGLFQSIEDVLGMEVTQAIATGKPLKKETVRPPILIRRNEMVTVYARSSGIQVRTTARARNDGSLGDLITVESLEKRRPYFARVSGIQQVEIYARAVRSDRPGTATLGGF